MVRFSPVHLATHAASHLWETGPYSRESGREKGGKAIVRLRIPAIRGRFPLPEAFQGPKTSHGRAERRRVSWSRQPCCFHLSNGRRSRRRFGFASTRSTAGERRMRRSPFPMCSPTAGRRSEICARSLAGIAAMENERTIAGRLTRDRHRFWKVRAPSRYRGGGAPTLPQRPSSLPEPHGLTAA
jgi:hypothetical protein